MINVMWLQLSDNDPARGNWDMALLETILSAPQFVHHEVRSTQWPDNVSGGIVIIPGAYQAKHVMTMNTMLLKLDWCLVIVTSDEENKFPIGALLRHPKIAIWAQYPNTDWGKRPYNVDKWLPIGASPEVLEALKRMERPVKEYDWFFAGQCNCDNRLLCLSELMKLSNGRALPSQGFTQGVLPEEYATYIAQAHVIPSPGGHVNPDSFRFAEALEAGSVPLVDYHDFWPALFSEPLPFGRMTDQTWANVAEYITWITAYGQAGINASTAWWLQYKHKLRADLYSTLSNLGAPMDNNMNDQVSVIVTSSPIASHPSTKILETTIDSIRFHFERATIYVGFDGVRPEQQDKREAYEQYQANAMWLMNHKWKNVVPVRSVQHLHQAGLTRLILNDFVTTPYLLFVEADTPFINLGIDWEVCLDAVRTGFANLIRFHFETEILDVHKHLMLDDKPTPYCGIGFRRTMQWSQRPHLASAPYYKQILDQHFSLQSNCFIEDRMYGVLENAVRRDGELGWNLHKVCIYEPKASIKRTTHTDGRAGKQKWDNKQIW